MSGEINVEVKDAHKRYEDSEARNAVRQVDTYTGDGTTGRSFDVGFRPTVVYVEGSDGTLYEVRDSGISPMNGTTPAGELSIYDSGFTVGDNSNDADPNTDTETYTYEALV